MAKAMFGAGCFWGIEETFRKVPGVLDVAVGYSGGNKDNPTYEEVCSGTTGHAEVVEIDFDEKKVSFENLLSVFWDCHDPTQLNYQGPDIGTQYRTAILFMDEEQQMIATSSKTDDLGILPDSSLIFLINILTNIFPMSFCSLLVIFKSFVSFI